MPSTTFGCSNQLFWILCSWRVQCSLWLFADDPAPQGGFWHQIHGFTCCCICLWILLHNLGQGLKSCHFALYVECMVVSERMGNSLHTIELWCFRQSDKYLQGSEVEVDEQYDTSGPVGSHPMKPAQILHWGPCYALGPILLARVSDVLIFRSIWLVWTDYVYHRFAWRPYRTFPQSRYLAALDPLMRLGSPSYLSSHSHGRATPLARLPFHQFWHAWVRSVAITKISSLAYSVPYQASVSLCSACWCIASAFCDSIFPWLGPSCIYSVCTRP